MWGFPKKGGPKIDPNILCSQSVWAPKMGPLISGNSHVSSAAYVFVFVSVSVSLSLSLCMFIFIFIFLCILVFVFVFLLFQVFLLLQLLCFVLHTFRSLHRVGDIPAAFFVCEAAPINNHDVRTISRCCRLHCAHAHVWKGVEATCPSHPISRGNPLLLGMHLNDVEQTTHCLQLPLCGRFKRSGSQRWDVGPSWFEGQWPRAWTSQQDLCDPGFTGGRRSAPNYGQHDS